MEINGVKRPYSIFFSDTVSPKFIELIGQYRLKGRKVFALADENTLHFCLSLLNDGDGNPLYDKTIVIPAGEKFKTLKTCEHVYHSLISAGADRTSVLINLGGGVVTDLGGFIAATFMRGIHFVNVPTSLMGMIDASVGSKTGVDFNGLKNQIGGFYDPEAVFIFSVFLKTLPDRELKSAFAEMVKHALLDTINHVEKILKLNPADQISIGDIAESLRVKIFFVGVDPGETGMRKSLNFGHTLGHAIESWGIINGRDIRHGEALAAGMIMALYLSGSVLGLLNDLINPIIQLLKKNIPLPELPESATKDIVSFLAHDKKNTRGKRMFVLLERPGSIRYDQEISDEMVFDAIQFYRENCFLAQIHDR